MRPEDMQNKDLLLLLLKEVDEVKRYAANVYSKTDTEIAEIRDTCNKIERQLNETDRQVDRIERFERELQEMKGMLRKMERKF